MNNLKADQICALLRHLGVLSSEEVVEIQSMADQVPLKQAFVWSGYVSELEFGNADLACALINGGSLTVKDALVALKQSIQQQLDLSQIVQVSKDAVIEMDTVPRRVDLSQLIELSGIANWQLLQRMRDLHEQTGVLIGELMERYGVLSARLRSDCLYLLSLVRANIMSATFAASIVERLSRTGMPLRDLFRSRFAPATAAPVVVRKIFVGELIVASGLIDESFMLSTVEKAIASNKQVGEMLVAAGKISANVLGLVLNFQEAVCRGTMNANEAIRQLRLLSRSAAFAA